MRTSATIFILAFFLQLNAQTELSGVSIPQTYKTGDKNLVLNGAGIRKKLFIDVYVGSLYLPAKVSDPGTVMKANDYMNMRIHIVSSLITSDKMVEAVREGFTKSTGGNIAPIKDRIETFLNVFKKEAIVKGNYFDLSYFPNEGLKVSKNGKYIETIKGLDFRSALLGIWLSSSPVDQALKDGLLGKK